MYFFWTLLLALFSRGVAISMAGFRFDLPDSEEHCFYEEFENSVAMLFEFTVIRGGKFDIDVTATDPDGVLWYEELRLSHDSVAFKAVNGTYTFCFSNEFSSYTHKVVQFVLRPTDASYLQMDTRLDDPFRVISKAPTMVDNALDRILMACRDVAELQWDYKLREARSKYKAEELKLKVFYLASVVTVCILCSGMGQVYFLKMLFSPDRPRSQERPLTPVKTAVFFGD